MVAPGFAIWDHDPALVDWARAAYRKVKSLDTTARRHRATWFVGVDALDNAPDGSVGDVVWPHRAMAPHWHCAQVSIVYPGYPRQDADESDAAHAFRKRRDAAHVDGLLPVGSQRRRYLREPHAFILGVPLNRVTASPLVVWEGSHLIMRAAFNDALAGVPSAAWGDVDLTDVYQSARRRVFDTCARIELSVTVGQATFLHRHLVHGVAPWRGPETEEGRIIAYFRPEVSDIGAWL
ncbi:hypothetical protein SAMN04488515_1417 [Cognatiyoonia koreensis]|uniref:Phytanoyl-CoA dioxygenase (PhyH) n=1 Tax=Cognatiyoonia koreensis TaxID=364200 RepID=A0A1I0PTT3_9RHOB|nr:hypothetical protein [Cognatiyoonia koreensis]SEW17738.1 hypothetical protein SAMN04488515_1417 [Cognatiyoonia koreensis]